MLGASKSISGFDPRSVGGCAMWFDATDSTTVTLSSGNVTQWNDKSGNARNLTAVSGISNATVSSAFQNGLNVLNFSGNGLYRSAANTAVYPQDVYIVVAVKSLTTHVDVLGMGDTASDNFNSLTFGENVARRWQNGSSGGGRLTYSPTDEISTGFLLIQWSIANNNFLLRRNGELLVKTTAYTYSFSAPSTSVFQIGFRHTNNNGVNFSGYIGEIVVFDSQLGDGQRQAVEGYLSWKWGLQSPSSSPANIPGLALWLDAADTTSTGTGSTLSTWYDKSTTGNNFTNVGASCSNIMDGPNRVVKFPNTACMISSSSITFTTSSAFYFVFKNTAFNVLNYAVDFPNIVHNGQQAGDFSIRFASGTLYGANGATDVNSLANGNYWINGVFNTYSGPYSDVYMMIGTLQPTVGGTSTIAISLPPATTSSNYSGRYFIGNFAELLYYPAGLTTTQRQSVESYLARKWNIPVPNQVLPVAHPFRSIRPLARYFNPIDVPECELWLDAADMSSITLSGSSVTRWGDKSGKGRHYATYVTPPVYAATDGGGVTFNYGQTLYNADSWSGNGASVDIFVVSTPWPNTQYNDWRTLVRGSGHHVLIEDNSSRLGFYNGGFYQFGSLTLGNTKSLLYVTVNSAFVSSAAINGTSALSVAGGTQASYSSPFYWVGGYAEYQPWGTINELIIFSNLTTSQRQQIEGYLAGKWGLRSSIPAAHSFKAIPPSTALPFLPTNISGCALWLDAADRTSFSFSSGSNISQWQDKSGNGRNGTALNSPVLTSAQQSGLPVVTLVSASSQYFDFGNTLNLETSGLTIFFVGKTSLSSYGSFIVKSSYRALGGRWYLINETPNLFFGVDPSGLVTPSNAITTSTSTSGKFAIYSAATDRTSSNYLYTDGKLMASVGFSNTTNFSTSDKLYVGAYPDSTGLAPQSGYYYNGTIGEIIVYSGILSTAQRQQVEGYLAWKWDLVPRLVYPDITGTSAVVVNAAWTAYTFTSTSTSGTLRVPPGKTVTVDYLLVGGGGGASGYIGGGGGGGYYVYTTSTSFTSGMYTISIGSGGTGQIGTNAPSPTGGGSTTIVKSGTTIATGPGGGGAAPIGGLAGSSGPFTGGSYNDPTINSGGGAGAGGNGANGATYGGNGGIGVQNSITGTATYYGGGGGGGWYTGNVPGTGGAGGGANGATVYNPGSSNNGTNGLGGGGGGSTGGGSSIGGNGGSGIAIIRIYS